MLRRSNPEMSPNPSSVPRNPPTTAPTIPRMIVATIPPGAFPGIRYLAMAPAMSPNTTHNRIPIVHLVEEEHSGPTNTSTSDTTSAGGSVASSAPGSEFHGAIIQKQNQTKGNLWHQ